VAEETVQYDYHIFLISSLIARRYNEIFFMIDTCQANTMYSKFYSPNILATGSSEIEENSYSVNTLWSTSPNNYLDRHRIARKRPRHWRSRDRCLHPLCAGVHGRHQQDIPDVDARSCKSVSIHFRHRDAQSFLSCSSIRMISTKSIHTPVCARIPSRDLWNILLSPTSSVASRKLKFYLLTPTRL